MLFKNGDIQSFLNALNIMLTSDQKRWVKIVVMWRIQYLALLRWHITMKKFIDLIEGN